MSQRRASEVIPLFYNGLHTVGTNGWDKQGQWDSGTVGQYKFQIPNSKSGIWNLESGIWNLESEIWNLESGIWNLEPGIWNLESGIWNLESGI